MEDLVSSATRIAIKRAKRRSSPKVTRDDLLMGLFIAIARFGIVKIDFLTIDLEEFGEISEEAFQGQTDKTNRQKVAYSPASTAVFERAAQIARNDGSLKVELVHLLVAFAYEDNGLMTSRSIPN
jgi:ATP-dependent Clp protease ATP-binding subunit ClpA